MTEPGTHEQSSTGGGGGGGTPASVPHTFCSPMHGPQVANSLPPLQIWSPSWHSPTRRSAAGPVQQAAVSPARQGQPSDLADFCASQPSLAAIGCRTPGLVPPPPAALAVPASARVATPRPAPA